MLLKNFSRRLRREYRPSMLDERTQFGKPTHGKIRRQVLPWFPGEDLESIKLDELEYEQFLADWNKP